MTKILIADDNTQNLYLLETVLKSHGHEVITAMNGVEAIALALDHLPGLIVTDILMPEMDGFELCRRWKAHELLNDIPFVIYTATYTDLKDEQFALSLGADRFVIKPQQPEVLAQIIKEVLTKPRKARQASREQFPGDETKVLKQYNEVLFRKLEKKVLQLEDVIEKQKRTENELRESERKYRILVTQSPDGIFIVNLKGNFMAVNRAMYENLKYNEDELLSMSIWDIVPEQYIELHKRRIADILLGKAPNEAAEYLVKAKDGNLYYVEILSAPYYEGKELIGFQGIARDITERKKAEKALLLSEERYRTLVEKAFEGIIVVQDGKIVFANSRAYEIIEYAPGETESPAFIDFVYAEDREKVIDRHLRRLKGEQFEEVYPIRLTDRQGKIKWAQISTALISWEGRPATLTFLTDITEHKRAEETILQSKLLLQSVIDSTPDWMYVKDFQHKYLFVNKSFAEAQNLTPRDMIGRPDADFFSEDLCLGNPDKGIRGFHTDDNQAFQGQLVHNPRNIVNWADGSMHIYDTYKIPLADQSGKIYAALVYSRDITERQKAEDELEASFNKVQKTLHDVINTMAKIVEMRDPYTSGHQGRVAELAGAIAREMNLDDSRVEHLMMAASIHDVGKMYVPADILSKPGQLSEIEFSLIKTHAQGSYEILKDLEFSQPVALTVLQHHERVDGSGYPKQLKGDEMLVEAKILAVADVVEAMSSHRPYRPALGMDKALDEISRNKSKLYDPDVVDVCLELFNEKGFIFGK
jgi:PAS domain S-box-containing protein